MPLEPLSIVPEAVLGMVLLPLEYLTVSVVPVLGMEKRVYVRPVGWVVALFSRMHGLIGFPCLWKLPTPRK